MTDDRDVCEGVDLGRRGIGGWGTLAGVLLVVVVMGVVLVDRFWQLLLT